MNILIIMMNHAIVDASALHRMGSALPHSSMQAHISRRLVVEDLHSKGLYLSTISIFLLHCDQHQLKASLHAWVLGGTKKGRQSN
jgi:hypothetical protein